ncbi:Crp/Fnr family transcriptional regulator [Paenibacillus selenitireducens]|uniref:Crp/Fnr family transcriptional regulator n=1 Tax=Paenibacillus selenitireducens TaxID=1324314 RepID=A0A1T2X1I5_9BACL|nr:DoxX family protein [Paenibacillus selenitireducens]OPA73433.1 Crp/Fnr family transcriptional regulator [Paenibacillus selenitireducens]
MFTHWLRHNIVATWLLTIIRVYLGYQWITGGWGKITGGFDAGGFLTGAIAKASGDHPAVQTWFANFLENFALPNVKLFNILVPWGEFLVGLGLILGTFTTFAVLMGIVMNFAFLMAGTVSTNAQMLVLEIFIVVAGFNAGRIGLDYFVIPYIRRMFGYGDRAER